MQSVMTRSPDEAARLHGACFTIDGDYRITQWPLETAETMQVPAEDALGKHCWELLHRGNGARMPAACRNYCPARPPAAENASGERAAASGRRCAALPLPGPTAGSLVWAATPNAAEPPASPFEDLLIRGCLSAQPAGLNDTLDLVRRYCAADDVEIFMRDRHRPEVVLAGCAGSDREAFQELTRIPMGAGYPGWVTEQQRPMYTNDFQHDHRFLRDQVRASGIRAFLGIPLSDGKDSLGYLGIGWHDDAIPFDSLIPKLETVLPLFLDRFLSEYYRQPDSQAAAAPLSIRCFGRLEVALEGTRLPGSAFKRRKALTLLQLLLAHAPQPVHRDVLVAALWPDDADGLPSRNRLHGVVHALRAAIGEHYLRSEGDFYSFDATRPHFIDLFRFRELLGQAAAAKRRGEGPEGAVPLLEAAVSLYRAPLFSDPQDEASFELPRTRVRRQFANAALALSDAYQSLSRREDAAALLRGALEIEPSVEALRQALDALAPR